MEVFRKTFFPSPPEANIRDIKDAAYLNRIVIPPITEQEVGRALQEAAPLKAPDPNGIPNQALQLAATWITPHLVTIFN